MTDDASEERARLKFLHESLEIDKARLAADRERHEQFVKDMELRRFVTLVNTVLNLVIAASMAAIAAVVALAVMHWG